MNSNARKEIQKSISTLNEKIKVKKEILNELCCKEDQIQSEIETLKTEVIHNSRPIQKKMIFLKLNLR